MPQIECAVCLCYIHETNRMRKTILFVILLFSLTAVHAQLNYRSNLNGFKLMDGTTQIENPFWGGFNSPQFTHMDLNGDKLLDIIVFDRYDSKVMPFLRLQMRCFSMRLNTRHRFRRACTIIKLRISIVMGNGIFLPSLKVAICSFTSTKQLQVPIS